MTIFYRRANDIYMTGRDVPSLESIRWFDRLVCRRVFVESMERRNSGFIVASPEVRRRLSLTLIRTIIWVPSRHDSQKKHDFPIFLIINYLIGVDWISRIRDTHVSCLQIICGDLPRTHDVSLEH